MRFLTRIDDTLAYVEKTLVILLFASLVLLNAFNIVTRNIFGRSFQGILELSPGLVLWISLLGATLALRNGRHIKIDVLLRYAGRRARRPAKMLGSLFGMAVMALLLFASLTFVQNEMTIFGPRGAAAVLFPLFFSLSFFRFLLSGLAAAQPPEPDEPRPQSDNQAASDGGSARGAR